MLINRLGCSIWGMMVNIFYFVGKTMPYLLRMPSNPSVIFYGNNSLYEVLYRIIRIMYFGV